MKTKKVGIELELPVGTWELLEKRAGARGACAGAEASRIVGSFLEAKGELVEWGADGTYTLEMEFPDIVWAGVRAIAERKGWESGGVVSVLLGELWEIGEERIGQAEAMARESGTLLDFGGDAIHPRVKISGEAFSDLTCLRETGFGFLAAGMINRFAAIPKDLGRLIAGGEGWALRELIEELQATLRLHDSWEREKVAGGS